MVYNWIVYLKNRDNENLNYGEENNINSYFRSNIFIYICPMNKNLKKRNKVMLFSSNHKGSIFSFIFMFTLFFLSIVACLSRSFFCIDLSVHIVRQKKRIVLQDKKKETDKSIYVYTK